MIARPGHATVVSEHSVLDSSRSLFALVLGLTAILGAPARFWYLTGHCFAATTNSLPSSGRHVLTRSDPWLLASAQVDIHGDPYGMLAAHPVAPLVSLHHLDYVSPISPRGGDRLEALGSLVRAARLDPARTLQQAICYDPARNWSVSVAWGYTAQVYPRVVFPADLEAPLQTFQTWRSSQPGPFTFNTRPMPRDACERPIVYFLDSIREEDVDDGGGRENGGRKVRGTVTEYSKYVPAKQTAVCHRPEFVAASKVEKVRVYSPRMDPDDWTKAPRRHCCETETRRSWWGAATRLEVRVRKCRPGETLSPP